ncbi:bifunctional nicotinamidase/pyrazinamidase [Allorhodopirellula heiligendammensis]|uniref:Nicotinamidase n=1 Tax=Allorhodopirellula heiligendammensis TaxID=2714739 RepID=A0A5C6BKH8_9BACT|nr:bifunctional nicotinamidase/pyrazinamidase [Allorhodopirellula heiligendammensis]TWU10954.1 nicotinamidase/pyrazinamidase [Allorhodopirellula heiligendammensis]
MNALILVDLQNDFLPGGALAVPRGDEVIEIANRLMPRFDIVAATQDCHPPDHLSFAREHAGKSVGDSIDLDGLPQVLWPVHCVAKTLGCEFPTRLQSALITKVFPKGTDRRRDSYSGFYDNGGIVATGLADYLQRVGVQDVYVMGLATDYCVRATAIDAAKLGLTTYLIEDGCRGVDLSPGDCDRAISEMEEAGVRRANSNEMPAVA